jgi:hypothetical protein
MALEHWDADVLVSGDRYFLAQGSMEKIRSWSAAICQNRRQQGKGLPRFGGAWDGLIVLQPELESEDLEAWWDCP